MADSGVMSYRAICAHGKVRAMMVDPLSDKTCQKSYTASALRELGKWNKWAATIDRVDIATARKSDMHCDVCDAPRLRKRKAANEKQMAL